MDKEKFSPAFEAAKAFVDKAREQQLSRHIIRHRLDAWIGTVSSADEAKEVSGYVSEKDESRFLTRWLEFTSGVDDVFGVIHCNDLELTDELHSRAIEKAIALAKNHKEAMFIWFCADEESELENKAFEKALSLCVYKDDVCDVCNEIVDAISGWNVLVKKDMFLLAFKRADELTEKPHEQSGDD